MKRWLSAALFRRSVILSTAAGFGVAAFSCSPAGTDSKVTGGPDEPGPGGGTGPSTPGSAGKGGGITIGGEIVKETPDGPCTGLECQVPSCTGSPSTSISGKVYDPAGKMPLYNVMVYVPNGPVPAFTEGISCDRCGASITNPVTAAISDESGSFKLEKAPAGANIPVVIQVGKWRRQITIPNVAPCADTALMDPQLTRLPRKQSEGDIPRIAIAAGGADAMECFPRRLGLDDSEFTTSAGQGRVHLYTATDSGADLSVKAFDATLNGGAAFPHSMELWSSLDNLKKYDIVVLSCEGNALNAEKPPASRQMLYDYLSQGGRVFASHWHNVWFSDGPAAVQSVGNWNNRDNPVESGTLPATIDQSFPKGEALAKWLVNVGASTTQGTLTVTMPRDNLQMVDPTLAREWITVQNPKYAGAEKSIQYMSFNTPVGAPEAEVCGRAVFTGLHVSTDVEDETVQPAGFPLSCAQSELSPEEKAVAFMLFDLSACVQNDKDPPQVPK
jgi:hypothetical protein